MRIPNMITSAMRTSFRTLALALLAGAATLGAAADVDRERLPTALVA